MFSLTTGSFSDLEKAFSQDLSEARQKNPLSPCLVVCPTGRLVTALQKRLAAHGAYAGVQFLTLYPLAERFLADGPPYQDKVFAHPAFLAELIYTLLTEPPASALDQQLQKDFGVGSRPPSKGLATALAATIRDLYDSGARADQAIKATQEGYLGAEAPEAAATLALYARVVGFFETRGLRTPSDALRRAATRAPGHGWLAAQKAVFVYGFYDFTGVQMDLVMSLATHPNARLYVPYQDEPAYGFAGKLLQDSAFLTKITGRREVPHMNGKRSSPEIWSCSGEHDEVWLAAKEILARVDSGVAFDEIAVLLRQADPYLSRIREVFEAHRIPFHTSKGESAGRHPIVKNTIARLATPDTSFAPWQTHIEWAAKQLEQGSTELHAMIRDALSGLAALDALARPVSRQRFLEVVEQTLERLEIPNPEQAAKGVHVLEVQQARGLSFNTVFLLGLNEKVFPRLIREDPFLSDAARGALSLALGSRLGRKLDGYSEERLLYALACESSAERLILSYQRSDEEGKALVPSSFLQDVLRQTPAKRLPRVWHRQFETRPPHSWTPKELSLLINRARRDPEPFYQALGWDWAHFKTLWAAHEQVETFQRGIGPRDGRIDTAALLKTAMTQGFSPTALERLAQCPFQYYAAHVLRLRPPENLAPEGEITPQGEGQLLHRVLELFFTDCRDHGLSTSYGPLALKQALAKACDTAFLEFEGRLRRLYPLLWKSLKMNISQSLSLFLESEIAALNATGYQPKWFEQELRGTLPHLGDKLGKIMFYGKPDRIDLLDNSDSVRVVDYKSGKPQEAAGRIETAVIRGKFLQLPIYMALAEAFASESTKHAVSAEAELRWLRPEDRENEPPRLDASFWESPSAKLFVENLKGLIEIVEKGHFFIEPSEGPWGHCTRCPYPMVCRKEHMRTRTRAELDPIRQKYRNRMDRSAPKI